jgi:hypothetical protein
MNNVIKMLYSLLIGVVAMGIAKLVHPSWNINHLLIFGLIVFAVTFVLTLFIKKIKGEQNMNNNMFRYGIGFWIGGGVFCLINMIMNLKNASQHNILFYNYLITGVAVLGLILNVILLKRKQKKG